MDTRARARARNGNQVRLDGNEQRVLKLPDAADSVTLSDLVLPVTEHVMALRAARAKGLLSFVGIFLVRVRWMNSSSRWPCV